MCCTREHPPCKTQVKKGTKHPVPQTLTLQVTGDVCGSSCDVCRNEYSNIHDWILYTPEFQQIVMVIASPGALLLALWCCPTPHINTAFVYQPSLLLRGMSGVQELEDMASADLSVLTSARSGLLSRARRTL